jgi:hypothetical protein
MKGSMKIENVKSIEDILMEINKRKPYVAKYYSEFGYKPQWNSQCISNKVDFETWYVAEKRNDKLNQLGI